MRDFFLILNLSSFGYRNSSTLNFFFFDNHF
nr:MAG TPA: hypothetical protein [Caudoviricetes sp.]